MLVVDLGHEVDIRPHAQAGQGLVPVMTAVDEGSVVSVRHHGDVGRVPHQGRVGDGVAALGWTVSFAKSYEISHLEIRKTLEAKS